MENELGELWRRRHGVERAGCSRLQVQLLETLRDRQGRGAVPAESSNKGKTRASQGHRLPGEGPQMDLRAYDAFLPTASSLTSGCDIYFLVLSHQFNKSAHY